ncbi:MAG: hypothetical protein KIH67_004495 [Candidatus Moranbacteria bacterium]|nr:hypothetical protein [Candidatus Moranbacteria bacterium]
MQKYTKQFLDLALQTGIIHQQGEGNCLHIDPFFQGNAHAVGLAARACRELMKDARYLDICNAGMLMAFDNPTYPLLPVTAQAFHGGDAKGFVHYATYNRYKLGERPNGDQFVILSTMENEVELRGAIEFIGKYLGTCVGAVMLYSSASSQEQNRDIGIPVLRVITEQYAEAYLADHTNSEGVFVPPKGRESILD